MATLEIYRDPNDFDYINLIEYKGKKYPFMLSTKLGVVVELHLSGFEPITSYCLGWYE